MAEQKISNLALRLNEEQDFKELWTDDNLNKQQELIANIFVI